MEEQERVKVEWNSQLEKILAAEAERCLCYSVLHRLAEQRYSGLNNYIALPCIVLSTLAGTASVGSETLFGGGPLASISIGAVSISVGILNTLGSYFGWARRSEGHRGSSVQYGKVHRFIMIELSLPREQRMTATDLLKTMREQIDRLYETSPPVPPVVIQAFKAQYGDAPNISRPEIANGLDPIEIYSPPAAAARGDAVATPPEGPLHSAPPPVYT
jgi:hypothetical protein